MPNLSGQAVTLPLRRSTNPLKKTCSTAKPRVCAAAKRRGFVLRRRLHLRELNGLREVVALIEEEQRPLNGRVPLVLSVPRTSSGYRALFRSSPKLPRAGAGTGRGPAWQRSAPATR